MVVAIQLEPETASGEVSRNDSTEQRCGKTVERDGGGDHSGDQPEMNQNKEGT
jgi:hypothetical protein